MLKNMCLALFFRILLGGFWVTRPYVFEVFSAAPTAPPLGFCYMSEKSATLKNVVNPKKC